MTLPPRSRVSVKESVVNLLSFMRQLRLLFRMVGARANKDSELLAPTRLGLLQSNHVRMPSPRFSSKAALKRRMRRSEEHTSELQSLMRISYAVFCLKKKNNTKNNNTTK